MIIIMTMYGMKWKREKEEIIMIIRIHGEEDATSIALWLIADTTDDDRGWENPFQVLGETNSYKMLLLPNCKNTICFIQMTFCIFKVQNNVWPLCVHLKE